MTRTWRAISWAVLPLLVACAQIVTPTGGSKDETPPQVVSENPPNESVYFTKKTFEVEFDEFIQISSPNDNVLISPPMRKNPTYTLKRKTLVVKWEDDLTPDATYIFNFGKAIRDNNEGNILNDYTYVFSTGAAIDSMELKGKLTDALTGEPVEGAMLMLYRNNIDSLPKTTLPDYFGRTGKDGLFHIRNIPDLPYKVFALKDANTNFKFDVPDEIIGFLDTLVRPDPPIRKASPDTTVEADSLALPIDSVPGLPLDTVMPLDTVATGAEVGTKLKGKSGDAGPPRTTLNIRMFVEEDTTQFIRKSVAEQFGKFYFVYNRPVGRFRALLPAGSVPQGRQWAIREFSVARDTVTLWTTDVAPDTLDLILKADSRVDTLQMIMKPRTATVKGGGGGGGKGGKMSTEKFALLLKTDPPQGKGPVPGQPLRLIWNHPVTDLDLSRIELREDSLPVLFNLVSSDTALRRFDMVYDWKPDHTYEVNILDSAATDIFGLRNDTINFSFKGVEEADLGEIILSVNHLSGQKLLELSNAQKQVVARRTLTSDGEVVFRKLRPGKYTIVMVDDLNGNGRWDSGRYAYHIQPEPIVTLKSDIDVRSNWQMELKWDATGLQME